MQNKISINTIDIDENKLQNFDFESIIALEELITYFFNGKIKLKKNNYISFFKIFHHYQINESINLIFNKENKYKNIFEKLFKILLILILLDEIYTHEIKNLNEKEAIIIKDCLISNHQNFLILSLILINILQFHNMTNLYHNKINKIIFEKLSDKKLCQTNNILNFEELISKIQQNNNNIENKMKVIFKEKNIKTLELYDVFNKLNEINLNNITKLALKLFGLNKEEISEIFKYEENNQKIIKSVKVPFLPQIKESDDYILTIVLDLDETLIYYEDDNYEEEEEEEDDEENKQVNNNNIILRPGLYEFLDNLIKLKCELIIFSSSKRERAEEIIKMIEKNKKYFNTRLYREYCTLIGSAYVKDISKLGRDIKKTIIIDNDIGCFYLQQENGILVKSFTGNGDDKKLFNLYQILSNIVKNSFSDIRSELNKYRNEIIKLDSN